MKNILNKLFVVGAMCLLPQLKATASSHREAPLISMDPQADNTDLYVFRSPCHQDKICIIANYIPFENPAGGPNYDHFGHNVRYEIHIKNSASTTGDDMTYRFTFNTTNEDTTTFFDIRLGKENNKNTYTCERSIAGGAFVTILSNGKVPPPNIGPRSINGAAGLHASVTAGYDSIMMAAIATASTGETILCSPIDDPFFVDLGGAFDVGNFRRNGRDAVAKFNCHTIAMEIPISTLQASGLPADSAVNILDSRFIIGVWASASRPQITTLSATGDSAAIAGTWVQVSRIGMPLTNEVINPIGVKDRWNGSDPYTADITYAKFFENPELALYMDNSAFGPAVPGLDSLRIQTASLGAFDFRNGHAGLYSLRHSAAVSGTALDDAAYGALLLPDSTSPRAVDILPIFLTGVPNLRPYQLATGKPVGNPLAYGKPFINNFLPTKSDMIRLNMAVPVTSRTDPKFSSLGLVYAAVLGLTDTAYNGDTTLQFIPNMDGFPNGRRLEDDITTIELQAVSGVVLAAIGLWYDDYSTTTSTSPVTPNLLRVLGFEAGVTHNDTTFKNCFPYVQDPWAGYTGAEYTGPVSTTTHASQLSAPAIIMNAYPNPFVNQVSFRYRMDDAANVTIRVMDINGRTMSIVNEGRKQAGDYTAQLNTSNLAAGTYFAILSLNDHTVQTVKMVKTN